MTQYLSDNARGAILMTVAMCAFTVNDACMKAVTADVPVYQAIFVRGVLSLAGLILIAWHMGALRVAFAPKDRRHLVLRTIGEVGGAISFLFALKHMQLANLSAILQFLPLAVTLAGAVILREPVGWRRLTAIAVGFLGVLLIVRPGTEGFDRWSVLGLVSVLFVVVRDLATRQLSSEVPSGMVALLAAGSVAATGAALLPLSGWTPLTGRSVVLLVGAATFLLAGYLTIVAAVRTGETALVAPFRYTALIFAIAIGWAVFRQFPDAMTLAGAGIVAATGLYTFRRERRLGQKLAASEGTPVPPR